MITILTIYVLMVNFLVKTNSELYHTDCPTSWGSIKSSYFYFSDNLLDANSAKEQCTSFSGNLVNLYDDEVSTRIRQTMTSKYASHLRTVYVFTNGMDYIYSQQRVQLNWQIDTNTSHIELYNSQTGNYTERIEFCYYVSSGRWRGLVSTTSCGSGWILSFALFGEKSDSPGTKTVYRYANSRSSTRLSLKDEVFGEYTTRNSPIYTPDVKVFIGARSDVNQTAWFWSDGTMVNNSDYAPTNESVCQQMAYHYSNNWTLAPQDCATQQGFHICEVKFNIEAKKLLCNSTALYFVWDVGNYTEPQTQDDILFVTIRGSGLDYKVNYSDGNVMMGNLQGHTTYTLQASLGTASCNLTALSSTIIATTRYGIPKPISSASIQNSTNSTDFYCVIEWDHDMLDDHILGYKIYTHYSWNPLLVIQVNNARFQSNNGKISKYNVSVGQDMLQHYGVAYYFLISAYSCEGSSKKALVDGYCVPPQVVNSATIPSASPTTYSNIPSSFFSTSSSSSSFFTSTVFSSSSFPFSPSSDARSNPWIGIAFATIGTTIFFVALSVGLGLYFYYRFIKSPKVFVIENNSSNPTAQSLHITKSTQTREATAWKSMQLEDI